jgi:hypothetical protein
LEILDVAMLRLRFPKPCGLDLDLNLPFLEKHVDMEQGIEERGRG